MALTDENSGGLNVSMPVAPAYGNNSGFGFGNDWSFIIILFLFCMFGGGFGGGGMWGMDGLYPWMNNSQNINDGFRDQQLATQVSGIQNAVTSGFGDIQTALCGGFAGVTASVNNAQNAIAQQMYTNQISDLERSYGVQSALQNCCCENRAGIADVKYTIATEACANRATSTANTQAILDKLCQLELDGKNDRIAELERQLTMANLSASQAAQTSQLLADNAAQTQYVVNRVAPYPGPAYIVANPNGCGCNVNCGCGVA